MATKTQKKVQEPSATGHSPEAVPVDRTKDGHEVAKSAGNPAASRAGVVVTIAPPLETPREDGELGITDIAIAAIDGARWTLALGKETTGLLNQSDAHTLRKLLDRVIQETY